MKEWTKFLSCSPTEIVTRLKKRQVDLSFQSWSKGEKKLPVHIWIGLVFMFNEFGRAYIRNGHATPCRERWVSGRNKSSSMALSFSGWSIFKFRFLKKKTAGCWQNTTKQDGKRPLDESLDASHGDFTNNQVVVYDSKKYMKKGSLKAFFQFKRRDKLFMIHNYQTK